MDLFALNVSQRDKVLDTKPQLCNTRVIGKGDPLNEKLQERLDKYTNQLKQLRLEQIYRWTANDELFDKKTDEQLLDFVIQKFETQEPSYEYQEGAKFIRVVQKESNQNHGSAHAFVEKETGKLVKTASWSSPAKKKNGELQSKYNLLDDNSFELLIEQADIYGGHLYVR